MNLRQIAVVTIRAASIGWLFATLVLFTYLPAEYARARHSAISEISLKASFVNIVLHLGFALALYIHAHRLAVLVTQDLDGNAEEPSETAAG